MIRDAVPALTGSEIVVCGMALGYADPAAPEAEGGIRLAAVMVPTALNVGINSPSKAAADTGVRGEAIGASACVRWGYSTDLTAADLGVRYPKHDGYVAAVRQATEENVRLGFILAPDAAATVVAAENSGIGAR